MSSNNPSDRALLNLERDLPTTAEDVRVLRQLREETPGWLDLTPAEIDALLPEGALQRCPPAPPNRRPFSLE